MKDSAVTDCICLSPSRQRSPSAQGGETPPPSRAAAECGDYVHIEKKTTTDADIPTTGHKPCNGPTCSSKPATPVAPISVPATDSESTKQVSSLADPDLDSLGAQERIALQARLKLFADLCLVEKPMN